MEGRTRRAAGRTRALLGLGLVVGLIAGLAPPAAATARTGNTTTAVDQPTWTPCHVDRGPFECATVDVPLEYGQSGGATIRIALVRLPAGDPASRIGSLFINPGGPGGSGIDFVLSAGPSLFTADVRNRFDIVGFDPRGVGQSDALSCFPSAAQEEQATTTSVAFPLTKADVAQWIGADRKLDTACSEEGGPIIDHMSTANVARDLDLLREAVGDDGLTFYGVSYGSFIGETYANLFPGRVRAIVLDGVLDPVAWTTGAPADAGLPFSTRLRSDVGAEATLEEFFRLCDAAGSGCAFSDPGPADSSARYAALAAKLPRPIVDPDTGATETFTYQDLVANTLGALYDSSSWPSFASFLADLERQAGAVKIGASLRALWQSEGLATKRAFPRYPDAAETFPAVACADSTNPSSYTAWTTAADNAEAAHGWFGRIWTWVSSTCAEWPGADADRYTGPFDATTAAPVLVVGNEFDPATRYEGAAAVHEMLPGSALLTVHGWGHTSLFLSTCADDAIATYLVSVVTPPDGMVCEQDLAPFGGPGAGAAAPSTLSAGERTTLEREAAARAAIGRSVRAALVGPWAAGEAPNPAP